LYRYTAGPDAALFDETLKAQLVPLEKVARAPILAPIAGILLNLDEAEERATAAADRDDEDDSNDADAAAGALRPSHSICAELASSSCDLSQLDFMCDFEWSAHFTPGDASLARLGPLRDFVSRVKTVSCVCLLARWGYWGTFFLYVLAHDSLKQA
jgi:Kip1 ubiquitination-promoting complex protein 1